MRGATPVSQGMTSRITLLSTILQGLEHIPETTTWNQLTVHFLVTVIKMPHHLVPELLPMTAGFTKDISGLHK